LGVGFIISRHGQTGCLSTFDIQYPYYTLCAPIVIGVLVGVFSLEMNSFSNVNPERQEYITTKL